MADYGADESGFPLSSLEAIGDLTDRQQRRLGRLTKAQVDHLFPVGAELERRRDKLRQMCVAFGWEFVEAAS